MILIQRAATLTVFLFVSVTVMAQNVEQQALLERIRADHTVLQRAEQDYRIRRDRGELSLADATDYQAFLARLRVRVDESCAVLASTGDAMDLPADLPCRRDAVVGNPAVREFSPGASGAERAALLDAQLRAGLSEFDEMLLQEQERVKAGAASSTGRGTGSSGAGSGSGPGSGGEREKAESLGQAGKTGESKGPGQDQGQGQGGLGRGDQRPGAQGQSPERVDASGDDVVARQLREAAEKESDPELKEKLWEEYRKYKSGAGK